MVKSYGTGFGSVCQGSMDAKRGYSGEQPRSVIPLLHSRGAMVLMSWVVPWSLR